MRYRIPSIIALAALIAGCKSSDKNAAGPVDTALASDIKHHIAVLANDSLLGRKPFTKGEDKTIAYISSEFKKLGLEPGNNGSYYQDVPMVEVTPAMAPTMQISGKADLSSLVSGTDFVATTRREMESVDLKNSPLVFAGFGVVAPEYGWNDYKGLDVKGKTVVVLVNDPGFKAKEHLFKGDTMTYYGRWTYKYEEAARQGAAGVIIVHQTEPASYPFKVIGNSNTGAKLYLQQADKHMNRCQVEGWITEDVAKQLLSGAGITEDMREYARKKDFKAVPLNSTISISIKNKLKYSTSHNVIATLKGSARPNEYVIYSAHWDHFGIGKPDAKGDSIYNGAIDNASGVAAILAVARKFVQAKEKPGRSIVFLAVTAEEQGLLGSEYYGTHPVYPLNKTVADLNIDALSDFGATSDLSITGKGQNDLDDYVDAIAKSNAWTVNGDANPGSGSYYRSDHFNFAKVGVPALDLHTGVSVAGKDENFGRDKEKDYTENRYHQPSDEYTNSMNTEGMAQATDVMYQIGYKMANETTFPGWKKGSEFKAIRDRSLAMK